MDFPSFEKLATPEKFSEWARLGISTFVKHEPKSEIELQAAHIIESAVNAAVISCAAMLSDYSNMLEEHLKRG